MTYRIGHALMVGIWRAIVAAFVSGYLLLLSIWLAGDSKFLWLPILGVAISVPFMFVEGFVVDFFYIPTQSKNVEGQSN